MRKRWCAAAAAASRRRRTALSVPSKRSQVNRVVGGSWLFSSSCAPVVPDDDSENVGFESGVDKTPSDQEFSSGRRDLNPRPPAPKAETDLSRCNGFVLFTLCFRGFQYPSDHVDFGG